MLTLRNDRGFTLIELLVASTITMVVLGGAVAITSQIQQSYRRQIEDAAAEQEGRYALDWISRLIRAAGNNPYSQVTTACPAAGTPYAAITFNPNAAATDNNIRLMTDSNPPDGWIGGSGVGFCTQANEDVTISYDADTRSIMFLDNNLGGAASIRTDAVIDGLNFVYRDSDHNVTADEDDVIYVETQIRVRTRTIDAASGEPVTRLLTQEVRIRGRNY